MSLKNNYYIDRPFEIGCFSVNEDESLTFDKTQLHHINRKVAFAEKRINLDLREGFDNAKFIDSETKLDTNLLRWLIESDSTNSSNYLKVLRHFNFPDGVNQKRTTTTTSSSQHSSSPSSLQFPMQSTKSQSQHHQHKLDSVSASPGFICYRGLLTSIGYTIYENQSDLSIVACRPFGSRGPILLWSFHTEAEKARKLAMSEKELACVYGGYKFERLLLRSNEKLPPPLLTRVPPISSFCSVVVTKLHCGRHVDERADSNEERAIPLCFAGEVDAILLSPEDDHRRNDDSKCNETSPARYVEIKTTRMPQHRAGAPRHESSSSTTSQALPLEDYSMKRFKLCKWWLQSYLIGVPEVIVGFRHPIDFTVERIQRYRVDQLHRIPKHYNARTRRQEFLWDPNLCLRAIHEFLVRVENEMNKLSDSTEQRECRNKNENGATGSGDNNDINDDGEKEEDCCEMLHIYWHPKNAPNFEFSRISQNSPKANQFDFMPNWFKKATLENLNLIA